MHRYTEAAFTDIAGLQYVAPVLSLLIAVLVFLGLGLRLQEYAISRRRSQRCGEGGTLWLTP